MLVGDFELFFDENLVGVLINVLIYFGMFGLVGVVISVGCNGGLVVFSYYEVLFVFIGGIIIQVIVDVLG